MKAPAVVIGHSLGAVAALVAAVAVGFDFFYQSWNHRKSTLPINTGYWNEGYVLPNMNTTMAYRMVMSIAYPRVREIIEQVVASGLIYQPSGVRDFKSKIRCRPGSHSPFPDACCARASCAASTTRRGRTSADSIAATSSSCTSGSGTCCRLS